MSNVVSQAGLGPMAAKPGAMLCTVERRTAMAGERPDDGMNFATKVAVVRVPGGALGIFDGDHAGCPSAPFRPFRLQASQCGREQAGAAFWDICSRWGLDHRNERARFPR